MQSHFVVSLWEQKQHALEAASLPTVLTMNPVTTTQFRDLVIRLSYMGLIRGRVVDGTKLLVHMEIQPITLAQRQTVDHGIKQILG